MQCERHDWVEDGTAFVGLYAPSILAARRALTQPGTDPVGYVVSGIPDLEPPDDDEDGAPGPGAPGDPGPGGSEPDDGGSGGRDGGGGRDDDDAGGRRPGDWPDWGSPGGGRPGGGAPGGGGGGGPWAVMPGAVGPGDGLPASTLPAPDPGGDDTDAQDPDSTPTPGPEEDLPEPDAPDEEPGRQRDPVSCYPGLDKERYDEDGGRIERDPAKLNTYMASYGYDGVLRWSGNGDVYHFECGNRVYFIARPRLGKRRMEGKTIGYRLDAKGRCVVFYRGDHIPVRRSC